MQESLVVRHFGDISPNRFYNCIYHSNMVKGGPPLIEGEVGDYFFKRFYYDEEENLEHSALTYRNFICFDIIRRNSYG